MSRSSFFKRKRVFLTQTESAMGFRSKTPQAVDALAPDEDVSKIKKKYDMVKRENIKKTQYLEWLKGKLFEVKSSANCIKSDKNKYDTRYGEIENEIEKTSSHLNQEFETKKTYDHMLSRKKTEGTHLSLVINKFSEDLKNARHQLDFETSKAIKMKEKKYALKAMRKELRKTLSEDECRHKQHVSLLEKNIEIRKEMSKQDEEKKKRHADILEMAAINSRNAREKSLREKINISKMIYDMLIEREAKYKNAGNHIETAFEDIRIKTGYSNHKEILSKFIVKDKNQDRLIESVEHSESKVESLKKEYSAVKRQLKDAILLHGTSEEDPAYVPVKDAYKKFKKIRDQERKSSEAFEAAEKWGQRICEKLKIEQCETLEQNVDRITAKICEITEKANMKF